MEDQKNSLVTNDVNNQENQPTFVQSSDTKKKQTTPTLNPDVEYVNRTLP